MVLPDAEPGIVSLYVNDQILGTFEVPQTISIALKEFSRIVTLPGGETRIRLKSVLSEKEGGPRPPAGRGVAFGMLFLLEAERVENEEP